MQVHEVRLRGAESWGGGGWGRTVRYEPSGGVVPSRCGAAGLPGGRPRALGRVRVDATI